MYQFWLISYNKYTTLMQDVNNRGSLGWVSEDVDGNSELSVQLFCSLKLLQ